MDTVTVYMFEIYDQHSGDMKHSRRMATREGVARLGGKIIAGSGVEIDRWRLDPGEPDLTPVGFVP